MDTWPCLLEAFPASESWVRAVSGPQGSQRKQEEVPSRLGQGAEGQCSPQGTGPGTVPDSGLQPPQTTPPDDLGLRSPMGWCGDGSPWGLWGPGALDLVGSVQLMAGAQSLILLPATEPDRSGGRAGTLIPRPSWH